MPPDEKTILRLADLEVGLARVEKDIEAMGKDITELDKHSTKFFNILTGNGEPGLVAVVEVNTLWRKEQRSIKKMWANILYKSLLGLGVAYVAFKAGW